MTHQARPASKRMWAILHVPSRNWTGGESDLHLFSYEHEARLEATRRGGGLDVWRPIPVDVKVAIKKRHVERALSVRVVNGELVIRIGVNVLAYAAAFSAWANPFNEDRDDYIRTFAIEDANEFADDVLHAMLNEREDGSTPLSDFIDEMSEAAVNDGSLGLHEDEQAIPHGQFAPCETWALSPDTDTA